MAKESMKARERKRAKIVAKYAEKRKALKEAGDYEALQKLPKNASPIRMHNRCKLTGRPKGYMRQFGVSRVTFRELANQGFNLYTDEEEEVDGGFEHSGNFALIDKNGFLRSRLVNGNPIIYYNGIISEKQQFGDDGMREEISLLKEDITKLLKE